MFYCVAVCILLHQTIESTYTKGFFLWFMFSLARDKTRIWTSLSCFHISRHKIFVGVIFAKFCDGNYVYGWFNCTVCVCIEYSQGIFRLESIHIGLHSLKNTEHLHSNKRIRQDIRCYIKFNLIQWIDHFAFRSDFDILKWVDGTNGANTNLSSNDFCGVCFHLGLLRQFFVPQFIHSYPVINIRGNTWQKC